MIADEEDVKTYSPSADREMELVSKQLKVRALDYGVTDGNQSVMIWTDTASLTGRSSELGIFQFSVSCKFFFFSF